MSCMYDAVQKLDASVVSMDFFGAVYNALEEEIETGRVCLGEYESPRRVLVYCTEEDVVEMPKDILDKLQTAWVCSFEGPFDIQTEDRVLEPTDSWCERHPNLVANVN